MSIRIFTFLMIAVSLLSACLPYSLETPVESLPSAVSREAAPTSTPGALLIWESNDASCQTAVFVSQSLSYGDCGKPLTIAPAQTTGHESRLAEIADSYASFASQTQAGSLILRGRGESVPTASEKRAITEWAKLMFEMAQAARAGAAWSLAFAWHREGGVGGFCDDVVVYRTGLVTASDCKGFNAQTYLTASQLEQLYGWLDHLNNIDYDDSTAPLADGMNITLTLSGNGQTQADEQTIRDILDFAVTLDAQLGYAAHAAPEVADAQAALNDYLVALHTGDYELGAKLYGGDTSLLQSWNPDIKNDLSALLERACIQNGLQCLSPRSITYFASEVDGHHFWVEFNNPNGTLFHQGPCCGETNSLMVSRYLFFVEKNLSDYFVTELPPYAP
jgi:hypothetical protein